MLRSCVYLSGAVDKCVFALPVPTAQQPYIHHLRQEWCKWHN